MSTISRDKLKLQKTNGQYIISIILLKCLQNYEKRKQRINDLSRTTFLIVDKQIKKNIHISSSYLKKKVVQNFTIFCILSNVL